MIRGNQIIAATTALAITATTIVFAYGQSTATMEQLFSFSFASLAAKVALTAAMLIIMFFPRPRSFVNRAIIGLVATSVLAFATYGALASTLPLGDAIMLFAGTLIAMIESVEATMPHRKPTAVNTDAEPALAAPATKA